MKTLALTIFYLLISLGTVQAVSVTFRVNMSHYIEEALFDPDNEFVDVAGNFNGWGAELTRLEAIGSDSLYAVTLMGFQVGQFLEFKFRFNGQWDGREEFPGAGNNRSYTVQASGNLIDVWYNNVVGEGALLAEFSANGTNVRAGGMVLFADRSVGPVRQRTWSFPGGFAPDVHGEQVAVVYEEPGTYDVQLVVRNESNADTMLQRNYITVQSRNWDNAQDWNERVFYEIFVRSFYDSDGDGIGDFAGLTQKLDYLNDGDPQTDTDLGITGIWLMPIHPTHTYHGYNVEDYRAINPEYGTMAEFRTFLAEAHKRGIAVIIDFVMNHSSDRHPWFQQSAAGDPHFRPFYRWSASNPGFTGPWGQTVWHPRNGQYYYGLFVREMPDLNYSYPPVRDSMLAITDYWLTEIGIDGFRLDAIKYIDEDGSQLENTPETFAFLSEFRDHYKKVKPEAFTVGEVWSGTEQILPYVGEQGLDFCFEFGLAGALLGAGWGNSDALYTQMQKVYDAYPHLQYGVFGTNHDQPRIMSEMAGDPERAKMVASLYLALPGIPFLYYGEEIGMIGSVDHPDIRTPMQWTDGPAAGFSDGQPWSSPQGNYPAVNVSDQMADEESIWHRYRQMIQLRQQEPALQRGRYAPVFSLSAPNIFACMREEGTDQFLVVANLTESPQQNIQLGMVKSSLANGRYILTDRLSGAQTQLEVVNGSFELDRLAGYQFSVYAIDALVSSESPRVPPLQWSVMPNPTTGPVWLNGYLPESGTVLVQVFDHLGRAVHRVFAGEQTAGFVQWSVDLTHLPKGLYHISLQANGQQAVQNVVLHR